MIKNENLSNIEQKFLHYLNNNEEYPFKKDYFKFMLISSKASKEMISNFFDGFLYNMLIYECDKFYLIIYQNKDKLQIEKFIEMFNDDMGTRSVIFEGFYINKSNGTYLQEFLRIFNDNMCFNKMYSNIADMILLCNNNRDLLNKIKNIVLDKYLKDKSFTILVKTLFKNNLNISKTANDLYMHRNTLNNKLASLERDTTLSIQNFVNAIAIYELLK